MSPRHLLGIGDLGADGIDEVLRLADSFVEVGRRPIPRVPALRGKTVASVFFEASTLTRLSFETAAKRLSADVVSFTGPCPPQNKPSPPLDQLSLSLDRGESLRDTVLALEAMGVDALVVRHGCAGVPAQVAAWLAAAGVTGEAGGGGASVVNAGDGAHEHPTQALLDCFTITRERARRSGAPPARPPVMGGLHVAIIGDIRNSGVARSDVLAFSALGAMVTLVAPPTLLPTSVAGWPVEVNPDMGAVLAKCDVAYLVGLQDKQANERLGPSEREYTATYGLTAERARLLNPSAMVMHPGPVRRGIEVADEVIEGSASVVRAQVAHGVAVCMAILYLLLGSGAAIGA